MTSQVRRSEPASRVQLATAPPAATSKRSNSTLSVNLIDISLPAALQASIDLRFDFTRLRDCIVISAAATLAWSSQAAAQVQASTTDPNKLVEVTRVTQAPEIDGVLDDRAWMTAASISDMHQFFPLDHVPATEDTEILLAYDDEFLYVGARLLDSEPDQITARSMAQGESIQFDDTI